MVTITSNSTLPLGTQIEAYHPDVLRLLVPRLRWDEPDDILLIPMCPNCGSSRTLNIYLQQDPELIVGPSFRAWCRDCREKLAETIDRRRKEMNL